MDSDCVVAVSEPPPPPQAARIIAAQAPDSAVFTSLLLIVEVAKTVSFQINFSAMLQSNATSELAVEKLVPGNQGIFLKRKIYDKKPSGLSHQRLALIKNPLIKWRKNPMPMPNRHASEEATFAMKEVVMSLACHPGESRNDCFECSLN